MRVLYVEKNPFKATVSLPPGCMFIMLNADEGHIAEKVLTTLMQMGVSEEHYSFLHGIYEMVRVTHDKKEEN